MERRGCSWRWSRPCQCYDANAWQVFVGAGAVGDIRVGCNNGSEQVEYPYRKLHWCNSDWTDDGRQASTHYWDWVSIECIPVCFMGRRVSEMDVQ